MICYRDRTFCTFWETCKSGEGCDRALTPAVQEAAGKWMENPPICIFVEQPQCWEPISEELD